MPDDNEPEVKESESEESEEDTKEEESPESSQEEEKEEDSEDESEHEESKDDSGDESEEPKKKEETPVVPVVEKDGAIARIPGETPREYALRLEVFNLKEERRKERSKEFTIEQRSEASKKVESEVLKKYKPEEISALREVLPELAREFGYVRQDELSKQTYEEKAQVQIDKFLDDHPEYSIDKDPDNTLWERLKAEYNTYYKPPKDPRDFKKIFERIHQDLFGIQKAGPLQKINAAKEKAKVASHSSGPTKSGNRERIVTHNVGLRTDALKGFSEEEIADIESRASGE
jgi:hypothetical protein